VDTASLRVLNFSEQVPCDASSSSSSSEHAKGLERQSIVLQLGLKLEYEELNWWWFELGLRSVSGMGEELASLRRAAAFR
jgi:hypothetical protein